MAVLKAMEGLATEFGEALFTAFVDKVIVGRDGLRFAFKAGSERA